MIYGFDDNKNRVEVPEIDTNEFIKYKGNFNFSSFTKDNKLDLAPKECITLYGVYFSKTTLGQELYLTNVTGSYIIISMIDSTLDSVFMPDEPIEKVTANNTYVYINYINTFITLKPYVISAIPTDVESNPISYRLATDTRYFILRIN